LDRAGDFVKIGNFENYTTRAVPRKVRWLAIAAGCFSGVAGFLLYGLLFLFVPAILILGAILQPHSPRLGRWFLSVGALLLSVYVGLFLAPQAVGAIMGLPLDHTFHDWTVASVLLVSVVLVAWSDVALILEAKRSRDEIAPSEVPGTGSSG
jgi:hypothetical protein